MAEYKRKRRSGFRAAPKINKKRVKSKQSFEDIEMKPQNKAQRPQKMRVVKGKRLEQKRRLKGLGVVVSILLAIFVLCQLIMPAGVFETISTAFNTFGAGKYPIELESNDTLDVVSKSGFYYLLTDTRLYAVSNSGKQIFSYTHGFENPVLKASETRALIFDQGKTTALIFTLDGLKSTINQKQEILNAAIGQDGSYAFVTSADNYVAAVRVYKKNDKMAYEWFSSEDMVNNVVLAPSGKKIAVSTMSSKVGSYDSRVSILNFKSANAEYSKEFKNTIIYSLEAVSRQGFSVSTKHSYNFINWKGKLTQYSNDYSVDMIRNCNNGTVAVFNRESDKTDNRIVIFANNGKLKQEISFKGIVTDIALKGGSIYCLSDTNLYILDDSGKVIKSQNGGFGVKRIAVIGQNKLATVTDNLISEIKMK